MRPGAPSRELSDWISKDTRSGLPDIKPSPIAAAPELAENDSRRSRRIAVPSNEIIRRAVVTRNPKVDSSAGTAVARERRFISPRKPENQDPALKERGSERSFERRPKPSQNADSTLHQIPPRVASHKSPVYIFHPHRERWTATTQPASADAAVMWNRAETTQNQTPMPGMRRKKNGAVRDKNNRRLHGQEKVIRRRNATR